MTYPLSFYGAKSVSLSGRFGSVFDLTGLAEIYWKEFTEFWIWL